MISAKSFRRPELENRMRPILHPSVCLVQGANLLSIEAAFAEADVALANKRAHLTTAAGGSNRFTFPPGMVARRPAC
jgi:hypothetical protein